MSGGWREGLPDHECVCDVRMRDGTVRMMLFGRWPHDGGTGPLMHRRSFNMSGGTTFRDCYFGLPVDAVAWRPIEIPSGIDPAPGIG